MTVLPVYIDDWFSSQAIEDMDAEEERGYLRLLLHAAKLEHEGLPNDERLLANWSRLGAQWNKPTRKKNFRSSLTSGQKILKNFEERDGRLFNVRVLECVDKYREKSGKATASAKSRWEKEHANALRTHCERNASALGLAACSNSSERGVGKTSRVLHMPRGISDAELPESTAAAAEFFDGVDRVMVCQIARAAYAAVDTPSDAEIAEAIRSTVKPNQKSPGLWLTTVPEYLKRKREGKPQTPTKKAQPAWDPYEEVRIAR